MIVEVVPVPAGIAPNPPLPPLRLRAGTVRILAALIDSIAPSAPPVADRDARLIRFLAGVLANLPPLMRALLPLGLWLFELGTIVFGFAVRPFSLLSLARRRQYIHSWMRSRFSLKRQLIRGFRAVIQLGYYDLPEVRRHIGYEPEAFVAERVRQRAELQRGQKLPLVDEPHTATERLAGAADHAALDADVANQPVAAASGA